MIEHVEIKNDNIQHLVVTNKLTKEQQTIQANYYACDLSIEEVCKRFNLVDNMQKPNWESLAKKSKQIQLSIQLYLDDKLIFSDPKSVLWLPDSPWALIIESQLTLWGHNEYVKEPIKDILSVGICDWSTQGLKVKKPFIDCTLPEVIEEVWYQIQHCPGLHKLSTLKNQSLANIKIIDHYIWDSFYVNNENKIDTWEPKFSNNVGCFSLLPNTISSIKNLFFATAYTKNSTKIFTMDSAVESGMNAAREILQGDEKPADLIKIIKYARPLNKYVGWIRKIDAKRYNATTI